MPRRAIAKFGIILVIACPPKPAVAEVYPAVPTRSLCQAPYRYDEATAALCHFESGTQTAEDIDAEAGDEAALPPPEEPGIRKALRNENPMGSALTTKGPCELTDKGRFGGGLILGGGDAVVLGADSSEADARAVELWFCPKGRQATDALVACVYAPQKRAEHPVGLKLKPDGSLRIVWNKDEIELPAVKCEPGKWAHASLSWRVVWPDRVYASVWVDGKRRWSSVFSESIAPLRSLTAFTIGNDPAGGHGFEGVIDEIRFSRKERAYYDANFERFDANRRIEANPGRPYFRDAADLIFRAGFNGNVAPDVRPKGTRFKEFALTQADEDLNPGRARLLFPGGVEGKALMLGENSLSPVYEAQSIIRTESGTIAFWMMPLDWDNLARDNPYDKVDPLVFGLFQIDGEYAADSYDRKFRQSGPILEFNMAVQLPESADRPPELTPGRWTHLAITWTGRTFEYYVDGDKRSPDGAWSVWLPIYPGHDPRNEPRDEWWLNARPAALRFGTRRYWEQLKVKCPRTAIDDFRIYSRPLSRSEILNLFSIGRGDEPKALPEAEMDVAWNGVSGRISAHVTPLVENYRDATSIVLSLLRDGAQVETLASQTAQTDSGRRTGLELKCGPFEFGKYIVRAELKGQAGESIGACEYRLERKRPAWHGFRGGISEKVMPEWTPVEVSGNEAGVWGRVIRFGASGLPERIVSAGRDILAEPLVLRIIADGKDAHPVPLAEAPSLTRIGEVRAQARGRFRAGGLIGEISSSVEFDGMIWMRIELEPETAPVEIGRLDIEMPFASENARYIHWWTGQRDFRNPRVTWQGALPEGDGVLFRSNDTNRLDKLPEMTGSFIPYVCLAGHERGMAWFADNDRGWTQSDKIPAVSVAREGGCVRLILAIISTPVRITGKRIVEFGLHPIPVKPLDRLLRKFPVYSNVFPDSFVGNNLKGREGPTAFALYPEDNWERVLSRIDGEERPDKAAGLKKLYDGEMERWRREGIDNPPPQCVTVPGLYWDLQWNAVPAAADAREWAEVWAPDYQYYTQDFIDFASWCWNEWIEKTGRFIQGAYMDDCWPAPLTKPGGPTTYELPDGRTQPGFQFRGYRERIRRMRQICWDHGIVPHLTSHTTHTFLIPYHSFFDLILDGEDFYSDPSRQDDFIDHWRLDYLQYMHNAKWGLVTTWLGWTGGSTPVQKYPAWTFRQTRAYTGLLALHDIVRAFDPGVMKEFGLNEPDTVFMPYWTEEGRFATHRHQDLRVAAWRRPSACMVLLVNVGSNRCDAVVRLDRERMGLGAGDPDELKVVQADPTLLMYFKEDVTTLKAPDASQTGGLAETDEEEFSLDERPEEMPLDKRRALDPDGKFEWKGGELRCPVRRHDYRLFILRKP